MRPGHGWPSCRLWLRCVRPAKGELVEQISARLGDLRGQVNAIWEMQSRTNKILLGGGIGIAAVAIAFLVYLYGFKKPDYEILFANLSNEDASAVTQKLKDDKIPYKLSQAEGTTIKVPVQYVYEERVKLAGDGTVKGGSTGYELFDKTNFGMTDFQEKIAKTRAIEGELQRTIGSLSGVEAARVHLATPDTSLYSSTQAPTTASIAVRLKRGANLSPDEVRGVTQLVAGAVEGLKPENVTLVNQEGQVMLPAQADANNPAVASANALNMTKAQLDAKQRYESNLQSNLQSMLDNTLGPKRAAVRVATEMNFDANATESKTFSPQGTIRSEQTEREAYNGTQPPRTNPQGVPGTTTNVVGTYQGLTPQQQGRYARSKATRNFEISEASNKHVDAPGKVTRTSVAVLVNVPSPLAVQPQAQNAAQAPAYAVSVADVNKIKNVIAAAAGIDPARGDQISVEGIPFNPAVTGEITTRTAAPNLFGIPYWVLALVLGLGALVGIGAFAVSRQRRAFRPAAGMPSFDSTLAEELPPFEEHPMLDTAPGIAAPIRSAADLTREQMIEYVTTVAQENPDSIAKLIKLWMAE